MNVEASLASIIESVGRIEVRLGAVDTRLGAMDTRLEAMDTRLGQVDGRLVGVEAHLKAQPDLRLLMHTAKTTLERIVHMEGEIRMLRSAINDHARDNVTPGEMEAVHHDLASMRLDLLNNETRLSRLESVLDLPEA